MPETSTMMKNFSKTIRKHLQVGRQFAVHGVWDVEPEGLSTPAALGVRVLRILHLVIRGFREDQCPLHASALTYTSLMAIVPILALTLWLARGMGGEELLKDQIRQGIEEWTSGFARPVATEPAESTVPPDSAESYTSGDPAATRVIDENGATTTSQLSETNIHSPDAIAAQIRDLVEQAFDKIGNVSFAALGGIGLTLLVWMVLAVLGRIEFSFNRVWGVARERTLWRKFTDYLSVLFVLPVLILAASSLPITDLIGRLFSESAAAAFRDSMGSGLLKGVTVIFMTTLTFTFVIAFIPNTRVRLKSALVGGATGGLMFLGWLRLCAALQVGVARYGAIYGSFAVVPILLAWVYVSWQIVLFGAELAFATQNVATYKMESGASKANIKARIMLALAIVAEAARAMHGSAGAFTLSDFAVRKRVPVRFLNDIVSELVLAGFLAQVSQEDGRYVLLKTPATVQVRDVAETVMQAGVPPGELGVARLDPAVDRIMAEAQNGWNAALADRTIADILAGADSQDTV